ncbi:18806_t:CDS:2 [Rhizophagus irregularis]|nr:18806_t:CDS:2 [Rhizophagus irregularis]
MLNNRLNLIGKNSLTRSFRKHKIFMFLNGELIKKLQVIDKC